MSERLNSQDFRNVGCGLSFIGFTLVALIAIPMWGCPQYKVYEQMLAGEAKLKEAESSRQIKVEEAKAIEHAAKMLANAEIERARGVAEANRIIGDGLKGNSEYLIYLWIHALAEQDNNQIIYVPTESGLPILEANRFNAPIRQHKPEPKKDDKKEEPKK